MKHEVVLGKLIEDNAARDAVHVAVHPARSEPKKIGSTEGPRLYPGQHVGLVGIDEDGTAIVSESATPHVGIIDPYLTAHVLSNEKCWLCLYPQSVTSLRHVWTSPNFKPRLSKMSGEGK